ncbi:MAG TPA: lysine exporter LysO family protein [Exilispira sp.]|nr:lysine exporter LysO family protein [Exilispira sp.]
MQIMFKLGEKIEKTLFLFKYNIKVSMLEILIAIAIGFISGFFLRNADKLTKLLGLSIQSAVILLLVSMGYKLALNRTLFIKNKILFFQAIFSSILLFVSFIAYIYFKKFLKNIHKKEKKAKTLSSLDIDLHSEKSDNLGKSLSFKGEIISVSINILAILAGFGVFFIVPEISRTLLDRISSYILYILVYFVGVDLGRNIIKLKSQKLDLKSFLLPVESILVTFFAGFLFSLIFRKNIVESEIIYAGLGWYSLSSVMLSVKGFELLAILSFIHNVCREIIAILSSPFVARIDPHLPILLGGATSMDVMLPFVQKFSGQSFTLKSFYSGAVCSFVVSFFINGLTSIIL